MFTAQGHITNYEALKFMRVEYTIDEVKEYDDGYRATEHI